MVVDSVGEDGCVKVKFTGACTGCPSQPITMAATIAPFIENLPGVTSVQGEMPISKYAMRRIREVYAPRPQEDSKH